jgi:predicted nucleic acid-binding protein
MNLGDFSGDAEIFVDANIFTYFALGTPAYQDACAEFLKHIEDKHIHAVTSDFVLNEVFYALLVGKGSELLSTTRITTIKKHLLQNSALAEACYQVCQDFWGYLLALQAEGLRIVNVSAREQENSLAIGGRYLLLPTDALHVATCQQYGIVHCATADAHFERVDFLQVWQPVAQ